MTQGLRYITATNNAVKRFKGMTRQKLLLLERLYILNRPCSYSHLHSIIGDKGGTISYHLYGELLKQCICDGYITRSKAGKNVIYAITLEGKMLINTFCIELDRLVKQDIAKYGNGFPS